MDPVVVLDNGAWELKGGLATDENPRRVPNSIIKAKHDRKRVFIGDELSECSDKSGLFFCSPFERGFLLRWEQEHQIWDRLFGPTGLNVECSESSVICTEPPFNFPACQETMNEVLFEDYGFKAALRTTAASLAAYRHRTLNPQALAVAVLDAGFSFSHVVPVASDDESPLGWTVKEAITRVNVGGKILTNHLKEIISYRQLQVMEEFYVMNQCKEDACFVSQDFRAELIRAKKRDSELRREYVLPDFAKLHRGVLRQPGTGDDGDEQTLRLGGERLAVPEILFHPSDIGIEEAGLPEAAAISLVQRAPEALRPHLTRNCLLIGGSTAFPGFAQRFESELRSRVPLEYDVGVTCNEPSTYAWQGGALLARNPEQFKEATVTRAEYQEHGHAICAKKFRI